MTMGSGFSRCMPPPFLAQEPLPAVYRFVVLTRDWVKGERNRNHDIHGM